MLTEVFNQKVSSVVYPILIITFNLLPSTASIPVYLSRPKSRVTTPYFGCLSSGHENSWDKAHVSDRLNINGFS